MNEFLKLLLPWEKATNDQISDFFVYGILLFFIILLGIFLWKTIRRTRLIGDLTKEVDNLGDKYGRPADPNILNDLEETFERNDEFFKKAWQEFKESLITPGRRKVVYKTDEASLFFSEERLLEQHLNLRFWNSVSALLVGLGILGTFVGLVWGLIPFSGIDFTQTEQIQNAIRELLSGVSTAFVTSVWGMLASLLFNGLEKWGIGRVSRAIADLQRALDLPFTLKTQAEIAEKQKDELEQQTAALKSFSTDLADRIKEDMDDIMSERLDDLHDSLTGWHKQNMGERQKIIQGLRNAPKDFSNALEPSLTRLNTAVEKLLEHKGQSSIEAIERLVEEFQKSLSGSVMEQIKTLAERLGTVSESLITLPNQMKMMMDGVQKKIDEICESLKNASKGQTQHTKDMMKKILEELQTAIAGLKGAIDSTTSTATTESTEMIRQIRASVGAAAARLDKIFKEGETSVSMLLKLQGDQIKAVNAQIANSQETLEKGREMLQQMDASVTSVRRLIETTEALSGKLTKGADRLEKVGESLTKASSAFNAENEKYLTANRETTKLIQEALKDSQNLLNDFVQKFETIDTGLQGVFKEIQTGLDNYSTTTRESINTYLGDFSDQLTRASAALAGSVEALTDVVEELTGMNEQLTRRHGNR